MSANSEQLRLGDEPDAVPRARAFVGAAVRRLSPTATDLVPDVELAVTELVTNALLHAGAPVLLRLRPILDGVRVEVQDSSAVAPVRAQVSSEAMTGRGLALVDALAPRWGVDRVPGGGKVVWCEVTHTDAIGADDYASGVENVDALLASWSDEPASEKRYTVHLGDVPTDLLLSAKAHVDNLVREFTLATGGALSGTTAVVPAHLSGLIETVVYRFSEARQAIKRQALSAAARGEERTELTLELSAEAAAAGHDYLAALDEADHYARAARLLTLETPPQHRLFRRWYVESLVQQLRRAIDGEPPTQPESLEHRLLSELGVIVTAQRVSDRAARLQSVTAALGGATSAADVAKVVVSEGIAALGASGGSVLVPDSDEHLDVVGSVGYADVLVDRLRDERRDAQLPAAWAMRRREPVWLESRQERDELFPELIGLEPRSVSLCAVPLIAADRVMGALRFSFDSPRLFDDDERSFVTALAAQTAQALERGALYDAQRAARNAAEELADRLARLQQVTAELTGARDVEEIADIVVGHASSALGSPLASMSLLVDDDTLRVIRLHGASEATRQRWETFPVSANLPGSEAVRTNSVVVVRSVEELERRFPLLAGQSPSDRTLVCIPLSVGSRRLGVISLSFPVQTDVDDPAHLQFLTTLAEACSQALERAQALLDARTAGDKLSFLADASAVLARSLDYRTTLSNLARLVVPRLADWCVVQVLDEGVLRTVAVTHTDPAKVEFAREMSERYPVDLDAPTGVSHVLRTGLPELYPEITDEMVVASARDEDHLRIIRELGLRSYLIVPLTAAGTTFGTISLVSAESGKHFGPDDLAFVEDLARRAAVAVANAEEFRRQKGRLAEITRIAEVVQHAILPPVPSRAGNLDLCTAYVSAAREALIGGDLYEVVAVPGAVRLIIGDVRGKGLDAVRLATVVLGEFRAAAVERDDITSLARQMDARLRPYLGDEDFVTALIAEVDSDGLASVVCCGHPPAVLFSGGEWSYLGGSDSLPLGLGADPAAVTTQLSPGDRLLLYTDGILEARDPQGRFIELEKIAEELAYGPLETVLDRIHQSLLDAVGSELADDLALLVAEYRPEDDGSDGSDGDNGHQAGAKR
jgi:GAF domain-containing protein/anti-sigma regulatory factor (Ser/Thr protein kinase)